MKYIVLSMLMLSCSIGPTYDPEVEVPVVPTASGCIQSCASVVHVCQRDAKDLEHIDDTVVEISSYGYNSFLSKCLDLFHKENPLEPGPPSLPPEYDVGPEDAEDDPDNAPAPSW